MDQLDDATDAETRALQDRLEELAILLRRGERLRFDYDITVRSTQFKVEALRDYRDTHALGPRGRTG